MKIRLGFVGNSSSSSFLIYGANLSDIFMSPDYEDKASELTDQGYLCINEVIEEKLYETEEGKKLANLVTYGPGDLYFGNSWDEVGDDETGRQFKKRSEKSLISLMALLNIPMSEEEAKRVCTTYEEAWREG